MTRDGGRNGDLQPPLLSLETEHGTPRVVLSGDWTMRSLSAAPRQLHQLLRECGGRTDLVWNLAGIRRMDNAGALALWRAWHREWPAQLELEHHHRMLLENAPATDRTGELEAATPATGARVRAAFTLPAQAAVDHIRDGLVVLGQLFLDLGYLLCRPREIPWREISATIHLAGTRALPIMGMLAVLTGMVFAYQSAVQLRNFGADLFLVDMLSFAMVRELGPLITAILVAGRSGSSMTAQVGVMRVTEELDAMKVLGISASRRLILPRVLGLMVVVPLLTFWTIVLAMIGGGITAQLVLDIGYQHFLDSLPTALPVVNLWIALSKAMVFGLVIGLTASHFGLRIQPNTRSLASETTRSVVAALSLVVLVNALFTVGLQDVGFKS